MVYTYTPRCSRHLRQEHHLGLLGFHCKSSQPWRPESYIITYRYAHPLKVPIRHRSLSLLPFSHLALSVCLSVGLTPCPSHVPTPPLPECLSLFRTPFPLPNLYGQVFSQLPTLFNNVKLNLIDSLQVSANKYPTHGILPHFRLKIEFSSSYNGEGSNKCKFSVDGILEETVFIFQS